MPKKSNWPPIVKHHRGYDRVWVPASPTASGYWLTLGRTGTEETREAYRRLLLEVPDPTAVDARKVVSGSLTVAELCERFVAYYGSLKRHSGTKSRVKATCEYLCGLYGHSEAAEFRGPQLKAVQRSMAERGLSQNYIKENIATIRQVWRHAVSEDLIPAEWHQALVSVRGLEAGQYGCKGTKCVEPVAVETVEATLPHLRPPIAAMVRIQLLTGMRPGELCRLTPGQIHRSGVVRVVGRGCVDVSKLNGVWVYAPDTHKTERLGYGRYVAIGPQAQAVLAPWIEGRAAESPCFSPKEDYARYLDERAASRKTPLWPSHQARRDQAAATGRKLWQRDSYDVASYRRAIARAIESHKLPHWHPHQLRHAAEMLAEVAFDLDAARAMLGHKDPRVTARYGVRDVLRAAEVAEEIG